MGSEMCIRDSYKSDTDFEVGVVGYNNAGDFLGNNFFLGIKAREDWRKIYVDLEEQIALLLNFDATQFEIAFRTSKPSSDPEVKLYFDNVKLLRQRRWTSLNQTTSMRWPTLRGAFNTGWRR